MGESIMKYIDISQSVNALENRHIYKELTPEIIDHFRQTTFEQAIVDYVGAKLTYVLEVD